MASSTRVFKLSTSIVQAKRNESRWLKLACPRICVEDVGVEDVST